MTAAEQIARRVRAMRTRAGAPPPAELGVGQGTWQRMTARAGASAGTSLGSLEAVAGGTGIGAAFALERDPGPWWDMMGQSIVRDGRTLTVVRTRRIAVRDDNLRETVQIQADVGDRWIDLTLAELVSAGAWDDDHSRSAARVRTG